jgi:imidazolonepropionase-like amidohydrolase
LWDGLSGKLDGPGTLKIKSGRIFAVMQEDEQLPACDFSGFTVMPALIDCHLHLTLPDTGKEQLAAKAARLLASGIATVRDAGAKGLVELSLPPLRVVSTGQAISRSNFYGSHLSTPVHSAADAIKTVDMLASRGVEQVKIITSGIFSFSEYGLVGPAPFTTAELTEIVRRARHHGLPVMAHASGDEAVRRCLQAGVHSVEHGYFLAADTLRLMAEKEIFWVPTLAPVAAWLESATLSGRLDANRQSVVRRSLEQQMKMVGLGAAAGVKIAAGTDAGAPGVEHGPSLLRELELLRESGLTAADTLRSATSVAAAVCGLSAGRGDLTPGKEACLIAVRGNPLADLAVLRDIRQLIVPPAHCCSRRQPCS